MQSLNPRIWIRKFYAWATKVAESKHAERSLAGISFAESSFFPLPPDPILLAIVFHRPALWYRFAAVTTIASVLGGVFGYLIGYLFSDPVKNWILTSGTIQDTLHLSSNFMTVENWYADYSFWIVFIAAFTPVPYKIFTLAAGIFRVNFIGFIFASLIGRGLRFFLVAALASFLGRKYKEQIERYIDVLSLVVLAIIVLILYLK